MKNLSFILLLFLSLKIFSQEPSNLVNNPSFEAKFCCPTELTADCYDLGGNCGFPEIKCLPDWRLPKRWSNSIICGDKPHTSTPDYLNTCHNFGQYACPFGPRTQNGYIRMSLLDNHINTSTSKNQHEYICSFLNNKLIKDHFYSTEFYIASQDPGVYIDNVGAEFTKGDPIKQCGYDTRDQDEPIQFENKAHRLLKHEDGWVRVAGYFFATHSEKDADYINIGNFQDDDETDYNNANVPVPAFYLDDVKVIDLGTCGCVPQRLIENTTYHWDDYIRAADLIMGGYDVDQASPYNGNDIVDYTANVTYSAGNVVTLTNEFYVYGSFTAINEDCSASNAINITNFPNVITPNNDGQNDEFCVAVTGANYYEIKVYNRFGNLIYEKKNIADGNPVCMWNGTCNKGSCNYYKHVSDGTYYVIADFYNCQTSVEQVGFVEVFNSNLGRSPVQNSSTTPHNADYHYEIFPNPTTGKFDIIIPEDELNTQVKQTMIYDMIGNVVYQSNLANSISNVDLSKASKGIYFVKIIDGDKVYSDKIIIQ